MGWVKNSIGKITSVFMHQLPDAGGTSKGATDEALTIKTSPTIWEYEMFRLEWDRRTVLREIDLMLKSDTRIKRANKVFASTAVRKGITVTVTSEVSSEIAEKAQDVINELMRDCQINAKIGSWARILPKEGDLFLNPVIDLKQRKIVNIKRLPAVTMQRNDDMTGNFEDVNKAFQQIDPISLDVLMEFPLWAINHIRWNHEEGDRYGESQYLACRGYWKKLNMSEEDLVVRRRTRAVPRRLHSIGTKDNPGDWSEVEKYKKKNGLDNAKKAQVTTDYYGNGLTDIKDLNADAQLDHIKDIEHLQEVYMIGTSVPLHILGFGQNVNRDIVEDQKKQFEEDTQELRSLLEYGDSSPYSGLRFIFDFALALAGINPMMVDYNIRWFENDNDTADNRVDRVIKLRSSQPDPLISKKLALTIVSKDLGLENESSIEAELKAIKEEMQEDRQEQQTEAGALNPEKPSTNPIDRSTAASSGKPVTDEVVADSKKKEDFFPLHGKQMARIEKLFIKDVVNIHKKSYKKIKPKLSKFISKIETLRTVYNDVKNEDEPTPKLVEQTMEMISAAIENDKREYQDILLTYYKKTSTSARENVANESDNINITTDFINPEVQKYFLREAGERIDGIYETTMQELRSQLYTAYTNKENVSQWEKRIENVLDCNVPKGRAEMIARTELAWAYNKSLLETYKEVGVHKVRWLAVLDNKTCPTCRENHNEVFNLHDVPAIPNHPRCRCVICSADD